MLSCFYDSFLCFDLLQGEKGTLGPAGEMGPKGQTVSHYLVAEERQIIEFVH